MSGWPGMDFPVVIPTQPRNSRRPRHGSEAYTQSRQAPQVVIDQNGNYLQPIADPYGRIRSSSMTGQRPAQIIINNDNGAQNSEYRPEYRPEYGNRSESHSPRPRSSSHHRRRSAAYYDYEARPVMRIRSPSHSRRPSRSSEIDIEIDDGTYWDDRRQKVYIRPRPHDHHHHRTPSSSSSEKEKKHKRSAEDEARIKKLEEIEKATHEEEQKKLIEKELALKRLKEEEAKSIRESEDKKLKEKVIEEYKIKQAEEAAKKKKMEEEEEEKMIRMLLHGNPGMTERDARKFVKRAERAQERVARGEPEEVGTSMDMVVGSSMGGGMGGEMVLSRQQQAPVTHLKVHSRHISTETLEAFNIPYEWDRKDAGYLIIKQWLGERDQEMLFNHTKTLKERARLTYPRDQLKLDANQIVMVKKDDKKDKRKKSPNPIKRTSWFLT